MVITIVGGGNIGTLMAAEFASRGHEVRMVASDAESWPGVAEAYDSEDNLVLRGELALVTSDLSRAVPGSDWIWVTYPTSQFASLVRRCWGCELIDEPLGGDGDGNELVLSDILGTHSVARLKERGRSSYMLGRRTSGLHLASIPSAEASKFAGEVSSLFDLPVEALPNYLVETLTPSWL